MPEQPLRGKPHADVASAMITGAKEDPKANKGKISGQGLRWLHLDTPSSVLVRLPLVDYVHLQC